MKVSLAAQLFSALVADALAECRALGMRKLLHSQSTEEFVRHVNSVFEILSSRNLKQQRWKKPSCAQNVAAIKEYLQKAEQYFRSLREPFNNKLLIETNRKTGFIVFLICMKTVICLYDNLIRDNQLLVYLATSK